MELNVKGSFERDVSGYTNTGLLDEINKAMQNVQSAESISQIQNLKKLTKYSTRYRIKVADEYRIGVIIRKNKTWFVCFDHRNNFYNNFP